MTSSSSLTTVADGKTPSASVTATVTGNPNTVTWKAYLVGGIVPAPHGVVEFSPSDKANTVTVTSTVAGQYVLKARADADPSQVATVNLDVRVIPGSTQPPVDVHPVVQPLPANILVKCPVATLPPLGKTTCTATAIDSAGAPLPDQPQGIKFTSSNPAVFSVDPDTGAVTAANVTYSASGFIGATLQKAPVLPWFPRTELVSTLPAPLSLVPAPTTPTATSGTINGVRIVDNSTYQLGFTPLDGSKVAKDAKITGVTLRSVSSGAAVATVCGQVETQDTITTAIALDSTGSMSSTDPQQLRNAAAKAFVNRMRGGDRVAISSFDASTPPSAGLRAARLWQDFTSDKNLLNTGIDRATFASGSTPLYDAVIDMSNLAKATGSAKPSVLVLTDGESNSGSANLSQAIAAAKANGTVVYTIGLDVGNTLNFSALQQLASDTGGLFQKANDAAQLQAFFDKVYNAFVAQGCVQIYFTQKPASGTVVTGVIDINVEAPGAAPATIPMQFTLTVN